MSRNKTILIVVLAVIAFFGWANYAIVNEECSRLKSMIEELRSAYDLLNANYNKLSEEYIKLKGEYEELQNQLRERGEETSEEQPSPSNIMWNCILEKRMQEPIDYVAISSSGSYIIASTGDKIIALSKDGSIMWNLNLEEVFGPISGKPFVPLAVYDDGECWVANEDHLVIIKSGDILWKVNLDDFMDYCTASDFEVSRDRRYIVIGLRWLHSRPLHTPVYFLF